LRKTFHTVGAPPISAPPSREFLLHRRQADRRRPRRLVTAARATDQTGSRILEKFADARSGNLPDGRQSTEDWLKTYTSKRLGPRHFPQPVRRDLCLQRQ